MEANSVKENGRWFSYENALTDEDYTQVAEQVLKSLKTSDESWVTSLFL